MPSAEIITIGTEILLGEIVDTNAQYLARTLRDLGIGLYRKTTVGDNQNRIAQVIQQAMERCDIIITTGGLGPTVDDPTREAIALAVGVEIEYHPELWEQIQARFQRFGRKPTENNRRQAYVPKGAISVENQVGTAPAFIFETGQHSIISLPGVPREMEHLVQFHIIPYLRNRFDLHEVIITRLLHTAGVGESQIDDLIGDLEAYSNPTVGLSAHSGQVDIRITAKASSEAEAREMILKIENVVRARLGDWIYGVDRETLEKAAISSLKVKGWNLAVIEAGLGGELVRRLTPMNEPFLGGEVIPFLPEAVQLEEVARDNLRRHGADACLAISLSPGVEKQEINLVLITPQGVEQLFRPYGGAPGNAPRWAVNHGLDMVRKVASQ